MVVGLLCSWERQFRRSCATGLKPFLSLSPADSKVSKQAHVLAGLSPEAGTGTREQVSRLPCRRMGENLIISEEMSKLSYGSRRAGKLTEGCTLINA